MATPTLDDIRTRTKAATVKAELAWINRVGHLLSVRVNLMHRLYAKLSPTTPLPSEQGTTPEELATIVAEETERADWPWEREAETLERELGQATSDQWDQDD